MKITLALRDRREINRLISRRSLNQYHCATFIPKDHACGAANLGRLRLLCAVLPLALLANRSAEV